MDKKKQFLIVGIIALIGLSFLFEPQKPKINTIQGKWDVSQQAISQGYGDYLIEESDFDYNDISVYRIAQEIKNRTSTPEDAIKETLRFVVQNIQYSSSISIDDCYEEKASTALRSGTGDCVSMTRLVTALLRAQGIPTRSKGGCLSLTKRCTPIFAVIPVLEAQTTELTYGDFKKRGFLHEWVEFWTPEEGWRIGEATSGQIFAIDCEGVGYTPYAYDTNYKDRCVILSQSFWDTCSKA